MGIKVKGAESLARRLRRIPGSISKGIFAVRTEILDFAVNENKRALRLGLFRENAPRSETSVRLRGPGPALSGIESRVVGELQGRSKLVIAVISDGAKFLQGGGVTSQASMIPGKMVPARTVIKWTKETRSKAKTALVSVARRSFK